MILTPLCNRLHVLEVSGCSKTGSGSSWKLVGASGEHPGDILGHLGGISMHTGSIRRHLGGIGAPQGIPDPATLPSGR